MKNLKKNNVSKFCNKCNEEKPNEAFRTRIDKRIKKRCVYLNNVCKECESKIQKKRHHSLKDIPEYRIKNAERVKKYYAENPELVREKNQLRRQTARYKENRNIYIEKNKSKIHEQEKICKKKYHTKNRDRLTDVYVGRLLAQGTSFGANEIPPQLIKLKRLQIICKRTLKIKSK